jgi:hypothetical protein
MSLGTGLPLISRTCKRFVSLVGKRNLGGLYINGILHIVSEVKSKAIPVTGLGGL